MGLPRRAGDAAELRKSLKPLLEKRRRARINQSLSQLKGLILPLLGRENSNCSKLEKADVLEMTVRFLQELPALSWPTAAPVPCDSYREGYSACVARLARVLPACRVLEPAVSARLLEHLWRRAASATLDGGRAGDSGGPSAPPQRPRLPRSPHPCPCPRRPRLPAALASGGRGSTSVGPRILPTAWDLGALDRLKLLVAAAVPIMRGQPSTHTQAGSRMFVTGVAD
uniref:Hes family bHLH transcription factor 2 n=1 Tax=Macaca fascicularis TaxID=9541 RepID=A0A7N9CB16_MACFA